MIWIALSEKDTDTAALEKRLWDAADQFRANSGLRSQEYSAPVFGLIFLRFAEVRFAVQRTKLEKSATSSCRGGRVDDPAAYHTKGILYLPAEARFDYLLNRPVQRKVQENELRGLEDRVWIEGIQSDVEAEIAPLKKIAAFASATQDADTNRITRKTTELLPHRLGRAESASSYASEDEGRN